MPTPWDIVNDPEILATVRGWALTDVPPYPATAAQLRAAATYLEPVTPVEWIVTPFPDGLPCATVSCVCFFFAPFPSLEATPVYGVALLASDDQLAVSYAPPGYVIGPGAPKLAWPIELFVMGVVDA